MICKRFIGVDVDGRCWRGNNALAEYEIDDTSQQIPMVEFFCSNCARPLLGKPMQAVEGRKALFEFLKALPCNKKV